MSNLNIRWRRSFNPITETPNLSSVLELVALEEECAEGFAVVAYFRKLLAAAEI